MLQDASLDPDEYNLHAHKHENRRWGIKIFGCTIDQQFWMEFRLYLLVISLILYLVFSRLWSYIQTKRKQLHKRERPMLEKLIGRETAERLQRENDERMEVRQVLHAYFMFGLHSCGMLTSCPPLTHLHLGLP